MLGVFSDSASYRWRVDIWQALLTEIGYAGNLIVIMGYSESNASSILISRKSERLARKKLNAPWCRKYSSKNRNPKN